MSDDVRVSCCLTATQRVSCRTGTAIPSGAPEFTPSF